MRRQKVHFGVSYFHRSQVIALMSSVMCEVVRKLFTFIGGCFHRLARRITNHSMFCLG